MIASPLANDDDFRNAFSEISQIHSFECQIDRKFQKYDILDVLILLNKILMFFEFCFNPNSQNL
jgi:hypothetical protein